MKAPLQKLELTWIGKGQEFQLEPRILLEQPELAAGDPQAENMLIHGDNLLALKALEQDFTGKIKCIYIDPPYNTGSAFQHYDDGVEHSLWLQLLTPRLKLLRTLLADNGSIWISIDDNEGHYLKVLCDEVFGRGNFISNVIWEKKYAPANDAKWLSDSHDHILVFAKNKELWRPNKLPRSEESNAAYKNYDSEKQNYWRADNYTCAKNSDERPTLYYPITNPNTQQEVWPSKTRVWSYSPETHAENVRNGLVYWGKDGKSKVPSLKRYLKTGESQVVSQTIWKWQEVGHTQDGKKEQLQLHPNEPFGTPKPEKLLERILTLATNPGDWVLDSFLGSGTTAAVAHKMGRRWVGVELGDHARTHCLPRLQQVVSGTDQGGISKAVGWQGGGGFKFYTLAPSLLNKDQYDNWVISKEYNAQMLAAALAKQEGFRYQPDPHTYWKQARSSEHDFLFTTTQFVTVQTIDQLAAQLRPEESLLIACRSYQPACAGHHPRITLKKIPQLLLGRCEFGRDDYSLHIVQVPSTPDAVEEEPAEETAAAAAPVQGQLF